MFGNHYDKTTLKRTINRTKFKFRYRPATGVNVPLYRFKPEATTSAKKWQLESTINNSTPLEDTNLQDGDHIKTDAITNAPRFEFETTGGYREQSVANIIKANIIVSFGIFSIVIVFGYVLLFSFILFHRDTKSLAAPLFLFTFITSTSALTFGGIAISSAIAGIYMHNVLGATQANPTLTKARNCSLYLFFIALLDVTGANGPGGIDDKTNWSKTPRIYWHCTHVAFVAYYGPSINVGIYWIRSMRTFK